MVIAQDELPRIVGQRGAQFRFSLDPAKHDLIARGRELPVNQPGVVFGVFDNQDPQYGFHGGLTKVATMKGMR